MATIFPLLATLSFVLSPLVSGSFGGFDPNAFPYRQDDPPVQPAGWAFAIWGVIYLWLLVHAGVGATLRRRDPAWAPMRAPLTLSLAMGATWIPVANASPVWATVLIWIMLAGAVAALLRAPVHDRWLALAPVGLYAGWLLAASCVSLGLLAAGWGLTGEAVAAALALVLAVLLAAAVYRARPSAAFAAALAWAFTGIAAQNWGSEPRILALALVGAALSATAAIRAAR